MKREIRFRAWDVKRDLCVDCQEKINGFLEGAIGADGFTAKPNK